MREFWKIARAYTTRAWLLSYGVYLTFCAVCYPLDAYLIRPHSHAAFVVGWFVIIVTGLVLMGYVEKHAKGKR